jgi:Zn-dependent protease
VESLAHIDIAGILIQFAVLLFSLSLHEASHAWTADWFGDYTARYLGRVTLNPIAHIDPIGTVLFPLLQFFMNFPLIGWAKPVPVNSGHLRNPRRAQVYISLAGPGANLLAALVAFIILVAIKTFSMEANFALTHGFSPKSGFVLAPILAMLAYALQINLALALFNLIPIPPLDGHWLLYELLPYNAGRTIEKIAPYGFILLYALIFFGVLRFIYIPVYWVWSLLI